MTEERWRYTIMHRQKGRNPHVEKITVIRNFLPDRSKDYKNPTFKVTINTEDLKVVVGENLVHIWEKEII